jgi:hypothetical protein
MKVQELTSVVGEKNRGEWHEAMHKIKLFRVFLKSCKSCNED